MRWQRRYPTRKEVPTGERAMPILRTYQTRPVTKICKVEGKIEVTFANARAGEKKERKLVSQAEWDTHDTEQFVDKLPDLRELAKKP